MNKHPKPLFQKRNSPPPRMINFVNIFITPPKTFQFDLGVAGKEMMTLSALYRSCQFSAKPPDYSASVTQCVTHFHTATLSPKRMLPLMFCIYNLRFQTNQCLIITLVYYLRISVPSSMIRYRCSSRFKNTSTPSECS